MRGWRHIFRAGGDLQPAGAEALRAIPGVEAGQTDVPWAACKITAPWHAGHIVDAHLRGWGVGYRYEARTPVPWIEGVPANRVVLPEHITGFDHAANQKRPLTEFQIEGLAFFQERMGGLAHWECGAGKTRLGLMFGLSCPGRILVITRSSTVPQWRDEVGKWFDPESAPTSTVEGTTGYRVEYAPPPTEMWAKLLVPGDRALEALGRRPTKAQEAAIDALRVCPHVGLSPKVLAPFVEAGVVRVWDREINPSHQPWHVVSVTTGRPVVVYTEEALAKQAATALMYRPPDVPHNTRILVVGWSVLTSRRRSLLKWAPNTVIVDESHRGKGTSRWSGAVQPDGSTRFTLKGNASASAMLLAHQAQRVLLLSATPMPDRPRDLWAQGDLYDPTGFSRKFLTFAYRYCLGPETPVLLATGGYVPIAQVQVGDMVMGWAHDRHQRTLRPVRVLETYRRVAPRVRLHMASGREVVCTPDHEWLYYLGTEAEQPYRPTYRVSGVRGGVPRGLTLPIKHLVELAHADPKVQQTREYKRGYLSGLAAGDGANRILTSRDGGTQFDITIRCKDREHLERGYQFGVDLSLEPKAVAPCMVNELPMWRLGLYTRRAWEAIIPWPAAPSSEYLRGWLAGMYDAEGWGARISQDLAVNPEHYAHLVEAFGHFGFDLYRDADGMSILGGRLGLLRFLGLVQPALARKGVDWRAHAQFKPKRDPVLHIEHLDAGEVVCLRTESGNFIANGWGSHNCDAHLNEWEHVDTRGTSNPEELSQRMAFFTHVVDKKRSHASLPPLIRHVTYLEPADLARVRGAGMPKGAGSSAVLEARSIIAAEQKRPYLVARGIDLAVEDRKRVCIITGTHATVEQIGSEIAAAFAKLEKPPKLWVSHGGTHGATERRALVRNEIEPHPGPWVLVGTLDAWGEAIDGLQRTQHVLCGYIPWNLALQQFEGRFSRHGSDASCIMEYVLARYTVDEPVLDQVLAKAEAVGAVLQATTMAEIAAGLTGEGQEAELLESMAAKLLAAADADAEGWRESVEARKAVAYTLDESLVDLDDPEAEPEDVDPEVGDADDA